MREEVDVRGLCSHPWRVLFQRCQESVRTWMVLFGVFVKVSNVCSIRSVMLARRRGRGWRECEWLVVDPRLKVKKKIKIKLR